MRRLGCLAAAAAAMCIYSMPLSGQAGSAGAERSYAINASAGSLAPAMSRVSTMLRNGELDIEVSRTDPMIRGRVHDRLRQVYKGFPVFGGQVIRQMDGRSVVSLTGRLYDGIDLPDTPNISAAAASEIALQAAPPGAAVHGDTTLGVLPARDGSYRLAYRMDVRSDWNIRIVFVDALSASIVESINGIQTETVIGQGTGVLGDLKKISVNATTSTFQAIDEMRPSSAYTYDFRGSISRLNSFLATGVFFNSDIAIDSDNVWNDGAIVDAHVYQGWVYDYYYKRFGRRGLDDDNLPIDGIVHPLDRSQASRQPISVVGTYINNAFYCCDGLMAYGDGDGRGYTYFAGALDVVAHEMTHGVTDFTSGLIYKDESGALNEAFSDIMAAAVEFYFQPAGSGPNRADWQIAEDIVLSPPGFLRSMNNPIAGGAPDHYSLRQFIGTDTDDGGVHTNMTIATHAFYLAVAGGRNRVSGISVTGVGMNNLERMERIFYRAFTMLMPANARFSDARNATLQAATDLYGGGSNERNQLEQAWNAVGVF